MDSSERAALIRKGNELFNQGKLTEAEKIFVSTMYKDGLTRIADYFYFDKKMPLFAYKYYKMAGREDRVSEIFDRMIFAFTKLIREDDNVEKEENKISLPQPKVHPKLKIFAEEILRKSENN